MFLVASLHVNYGADGTHATRKHCKHTVAQRFDNASAVSDKNLANPLRQLRYGACCLGITGCFKQPSAAHQVGKYHRGLNRCLDTHAFVVFWSYSGDALI